MTDEKLRLLVQQVADMLDALGTALDEPSSQVQIAQDFDDRGWEEAWCKSLSKAGRAGGVRP